MSDTPYCRWSSPATTSRRTCRRCSSASGALSKIGSRSVSDRRRLHRCAQDARRGDEAEAVAAGDRWREQRQSAAFEAGFEAARIE
jgi:hypothetical protein